MNENRSSNWLDDFADYIADDETQEEDPRHILEDRGYDVDQTLQELRQSIKGLLEETQPDWRDQGDALAEKRAQLAAIGRQEANMGTLESLKDEINTLLALLRRKSVAIQYRNLQLDQMSLDELNHLRVELGFLLTQENEEE